MKDNLANQATEFVDTLTHVEDSSLRQGFLALIWAGGLYLAMGASTASVWLTAIAVAISLPKIPVFKRAVQLKPYGAKSQVLGVITAAIWGIAPFLVWTVGKGQYDHLAITMLGIGFLQVISQYRDEPKPAFIVAVPYLMLIGWFLYQSRLSATFIIALTITLAYLMTLFGFVWAGQKTKKAIVGFKLEQDKLREELEIARDEAEKANHAKSVFLANMSHELRTPLNGILGLSDVLLSDPLDAGQMRKVNLIHDSGKNLLSLLNDILDISKIEADGIDLEMLDVDFGALLQKSFAFWKPVADQKQIKLVFQKQKGLPTHINADPTRIKQCLNNLINNALKFTPKNGLVIVTATGRQAESKYALSISVQDNGIGINQDNVRKLFNPFTQADEGTTRRFGGTGLGLAITRKLCRIMGGDVTVQSVLDEGSVFRMSLMTEIANVNDIEPVARTVPAVITRFAGMRCLVVEDNEINLEVLILLLEPYQLDVVITRNGREAIEILDTQHIDFVLMDLQMPVLGGLEATRIIRKCEKPYANVPIIAMTANAMSGDRTKCINAGMDGYMSKPLGRSDLADAIMRVTGDERKKRKSVA